jgi:hypothetical protein
MNVNPRIMMNGITNCIGAILLVSTISNLARAETRPPVEMPALSEAYPAMEKQATAPVEELRFDYANDVHLFNVKLVKIYGEFKQTLTLFATEGAYLRGRSFVFPLQEPLARTGIYRVQLMTQSVDSGDSLSTIYEFTIGEPQSELE